MSNRAPKGGTIGKNGLQYAGGTFLPSTTLGKLPAAAARRARPARPFWAAVSGFCARDAVSMRITASDQALAHYGYSRAEVQSVCDRYNAGER